MKSPFFKLLATASLALSLGAANVYAGAFDHLKIMTEDFPPFNYNDNGQPAGTAVELLKKASAAVGNPITDDHINVVAWARGYNTALKDKDVMLFSTTRTAEREDLFKWAGPIALNRTVVFAKKSSSIGQIDDLSQIGDKIGVLRDGVSEQAVTAAGTPAGKIVKGSKPDSLAKKLASGKIKLWANNEISGREQLEKIGENVDDYEVVHVLISKELYFAFNKNTDDETIALLQKGIDMVK